MRFLLLISAGLAIACAAPLPAQAVEFPARGGRGDQANRDVCPAGSYVTGARVRSGAWIDQLTIKCSPADGRTRTLGPATPLQSRGGSGGGESHADCPPNTLVVHVDLWWTRQEAQVRHINLVCREAFGTVRNIVLIGNTSGENSASSIPSPQACGPNEAAVGFNSRSGRHVNALGVICGPQPRRIISSAGKGPTPQPAPAPVTPPAPTPAPAPVGKIVLSPVTVYDRPSGPGQQEVCYLAAGDRVAVLSGNSIPQAFQNNPDPKWIAVRGANGNCDGTIGGVWDDGKLQ